MPELYILYYLGFKPKDVMELGVAKASAYNYSAKYPQVRERAVNLLKGIRKNKTKKEMEDLE